MWIMCKVFSNTENIRATMCSSSIFLFLLLLLLRRIHCALFLRHRRVYSLFRSITLDIGNGLILVWRIHSLKPVNFVGVLLMLELVEVNAFKQKWILFTYTYSNAEWKDLLFVLPPPPPLPHRRWNETRRKWDGSHIAVVSRIHAPLFVLFPVPGCCCFGCGENFFRSLALSLSLAASVDSLLRHLFNFQ